MKALARATTAGKEALATRAALCLAALSQALAPAFAEDKPLTERLTPGLQCAYVNPAARLEVNIANSGAGPVALVEALRSIVQDYRTCRAIKTAGSVELGELSSDQDVLEHQELALARQRMEAELRAADQRATEMRFIVGPPPLRLTRARSSVP